MLVLPSHGGDLAWASRHFDVPLEQWCDLSTGISPWAWPVEQWPDRVFRQLPPQSLQSLRKIAGQFYGCETDAVLPVPGSQYAISLLPILTTPGPVAIPLLGYQEHGEAWQRAGHQVHHYRDFTQLCDWIESGRVRNVVVINPNNPTGVRIARSAMEQLQKKLMYTTQQEGLLIVDEAFMDTAPNDSLASQPLSNTVVLRSFGKFFGLAGVRLGFLIDHSGRWIKCLSELMGPWLISHPAVWVAEQAMQEEQWADQQRRRIMTSSEQLFILLTDYLDGQTWTSECKNGGLFVTVAAAAEPLRKLFMCLAEQGILVRFGEGRDNSGWLRFGLSNCYNRLERAFIDATPNLASSM